MTNKKAQEITRKWLVLPIVALVSLFIILMFVWDVNTTSERISMSEACKRSVQANSFSGNLNDLISENAGVLSHAIDPKDAGLNCFTREVEIDGNEKQEIMRNLANEMYYCFDQFNRCNTENIFGPDGEQYCFICSIITFEKKDLTFTEQEMQDFLDNSGPPGQSGLRYSDIFARCNSPYCAQQEGQNPASEYDPVDFDTSKQYTVIFRVEETDLAEGWTCGVVLTEYTSQEIENFCSYIYMSEQE